MAKSKLARRVRKIRNLKGKAYCVPVVNKLHCEALLKAFKVARSKLDRSKYWLTWRSDKEFILVHNSSVDSVGVYNHNGGFPCVKL
ncbi:hypothetical protein vB_AbaP_Acibel007_6 [Acinetobacter phage vB_AbaP_Acibel007]|uniref:Uncharacterized protein n=1 Tax=Acinetobacter phage vB_AbaP_Acibel007 TaxID=1481187 RepID=A0A075DXK5_9CAUD|nr:hypothetical protein vB_AbaP_Acibel007_6 [Acinetobacter phage vB_AbaP_Acibel007]AHY26777.1 hypothetical protein vB_AbaP_Acibel007_6 [Acinetobacter phage vB_AbaP_Acibel007]